MVFAKITLIVLGRQLSVARGRKNVEGVEGLANFRGELPVWADKCFMFHLDRLAKNAGFLMFCSGKTVREPLHALKILIN